MAKISKYISIFLFVCSLGSILIYGNYLMIYRPNIEVSSLGFIYPFFGKGMPIFISKSDYLVVIFSFILLIASMISANHFNKIEYK